jgi:hypothetical protein
VSFSISFAEGDDRTDNPKLSWKLSWHPRRTPADVSVSEVFTTCGKQSRGERGVSKLLCDEMAGSRDEEAYVRFRGRIKSEKMKLFTVKMLLSSLLFG